MLEILKLSKKQQTNKITLSHTMRIINVKPSVLPDVKYKVC